MAIDTEFVLYAVVALWTTIWLLDKWNEWFGLKRKMVDRPVDVHQMIQRKYKRPAKWNKPPRLTRLSMQGDPHYPPRHYGRVVGVVLAPEVTHIFFRPRFLSLTRWAIIPTTMHGHLHGQELTVNANGLSPVGNYYEPVFPKHYTDVQIRTYRKMIDLYARYMVMREENVELVEQQANAEFIAVCAKSQPKQMIARNDYVQQGPPEGGNDE